MDGESEEKILPSFGIAWLLLGPKVAISKNIYQTFIMNVLKNFVAN